MVVVGGGDNSNQTENTLLSHLPVCEQSVAEHDTLSVERVSVYVRFFVVRVALVHQVFLDHTSNPFSYRDSTTTQRLHTIPQNLRTGHM